MEISILAAESFGARSLACMVTLSDRRVLIDPGLALGALRHGLKPHPFQIAVGAGLRAGIASAAKTATDIVFTHFDGDHCPLADPNPYQLGITEVSGALASCRLWAPASREEPQAERRRELEKASGRSLPDCSGTKNGALEFSVLVQHGQGPACVMMVRVKEGREVFVHASDIQLLDAGAVEKIISWKPDVTLLSGPPLYRFLPPENFSASREEAERNLSRLASRTGTLIVDHHMLRSHEGLDRLGEWGRPPGRRVLSAAAFMEREELPLEAWRPELYEWMPVPADWHENYAAGKAGLKSWREKGWRVLAEKSRLRPCKWYQVCPVKTFTDGGEIPREWVERYCLVGNKKCDRYKLEEAGIPHSDDLLPDGRMRGALSSQEGL